MPRVTPAVKICGLTRPQDVRLCVEAGVGALGFVLASGPRRLEAERVGRLVRELHASQRTRHPSSLRPLAVGVFAGTPVEEVAAVARRTGLDVLQLHGEERPDDLERLSRLLPGVRVVKALGVPQIKRREIKHLQTRVDAYQEVADVLLLDTRTDTGMGGSGAQFRWAVVRELAVEVPVMVAGGIGPAEAVDALRISGASGVDVSSGVEDAPGIKNAGLIRELVRRVEMFQEEPGAEKGEEISWH